MMNKAQFPLGFVSRPLCKLDVFGDRRRGFRDQQRTPKTILDLFAYVVPNSPLIEFSQILRERRDDNIGDAAHVRLGPFARFAFSVFSHGKTLLVVARNA